MANHKSYPLQLLPTNHQLHSLQNHDLNGLEEAGRWLADPGRNADDSMQDRIWSHLDVSETMPCNQSGALFSGKSMKKRYKELKKTAETQVLCSKMSFAALPYSFRSQLHATAPKLDQLTAFPRGVTATVGASWISDVWTFLRIALGRSKESPVDHQLLEPTVNHC